MADLLHGSPPSLLRAASRLSPIARRRSGQVACGARACHRQFCTRSRCARQAGMQKSTMRWDDLRVFLAVARRGRLQAAGRTLGLDPTTAGRRIAALEAALGARLFDRSPEGYALTEAGRSLSPTPRRWRARRVRRPRSRRRGGAAVGHGAHRRAGRGVELPPRRRLRRALAATTPSCRCRSWRCRGSSRSPSARRISRSPCRRRRPGG